jgi:hypothetical protein
MRGMGGGMNMNMVRQAQKMQADMQRMQAELEEKQYTAKSGGGAVEAVINGKHSLVSLTIAKEAVDPEDVEMLQDMIISAVNEATRLADEDATKSMSRVTGELDLSKFGL